MEKVAYHKTGAGDLILYLCGIEGTGLNFYKQVEDLQKDYTVACLPYRPAGKYCLQDLVEDAAQVIDDAGYKSATVIGESFGGLPTLALALQYPALVERLILVNTFARFLQPRKVRFGAALFSLLPHTVMRWYRMRPKRDEIFSDDVPDCDRQSYRRNTSAINYAGYLSRMKIIRDTNFLSELEKITQPALIVAGTRDAFLDSVTAARILAERLPRARLKLLDGTGHMAFLSERVQVREWLAEFATI